MIWRFAFLLLLLVAARVSGQSIPFPGPGDRGHAASFFACTDISGCQAWLTGDSVSGSDGASITTAPDQSGNGRDFTGTTGGGVAKPVKKTNIVNGHAVMRFDESVVSQLLAPDFTVSQPNSICLVFNITDSSGTHVYLDDLADRQEIFIASSNYVMNAGSSLTGSTTLANPTGFHVFCMIFNGASSNAYLDGALEISTGNAGSNANRSIVMGSRNGNDLATSMDVAEFMIWNVALTSGNRTSIFSNTTGLCAKYAITCS